MKKFTALALAILGAFVLAAVAAAGGFLTFGDGAEITLGKHKSARIVVGPGEYGGIYRNATPVKKLKGVKYSFISTGDVQGGAPRWSIPIDSNADRSTVEGYAFIDAAGCGATNGTNPTAIPTTVSTKNPACKVFYSGDGIQYANWAAFVAAYPQGRLAEAKSFVIADVPGDYIISRVNF